MGRDAGTRLALVYREHTREAAMSPRDTGTAREMLEGTLTAVRVP